MPNRYLRETILTSGRVDQLDNAAEVFYRRLMSVVDDYGRYDGRPSVLRAACFPLRLNKVRESDISRWTAACQKAGLIVLYEIENKPYVELLDLGEPRARHSKYPPCPPEESESVRASARKCAHMKTFAPPSPSPSPSPSPNENAGEFCSDDGVPFPESLRTPDFLAAWQVWRSHLRKKGVRTTDVATQRQLAKCERWGATFAIECIDHSIAGTYQGLFPPRGNGRAAREETPAEFGRRVAAAAKNGAHV